jgi:uncharacterized protein
MTRSRLAPLLLILLLAVAARAAEVIPPKPDRYFNDYASVVGKGDAERFNQKLVAFEQQTTNQIVVAVYPTMQSDSSVDDYTVRIAQKWAVGQKDRRNGVVLFVFVKDHKMFINVGYGLEGALPDATAKLIIENEIRPRLLANDYAGGLEAGIDAIIRATKGEYQARAPRPPPWWRRYLPYLIVIVLIILYYRARRRWRNLPDITPILFDAITSYPVGGSRRRGGWGGSGGGGSSGSGKFSSGGGSFGGGGAGGSW